MAFDSLNDSDIVANLTEFLATWWLLTFTQSKVMPERFERVSRATNPALTLKTGTFAEFISLDEQKLLQRMKQLCFDPGNNLV